MLQRQRTPSIAPLMLVLSVFVGALAIGGNPPNALDQWGAKPACAQSLALFAHDDSQIQKTRSRRRRVTKSLEDFKKEIKDAANRVTYGFYNWHLGTLQVWPTVYRVDTRPPQDVKADGGLMGNPDQPTRTVADHIRTGGSRSYVSFSRNEDPQVLFLEDFFPAFPSRIINRGKLSKRIQPNEAADYWGQFGRKKWPIDSSPEDRPTAVVFETYEYRAHNVLGVDVIGGLHPTEQEVVTRGVKISDGIEWRRVTITVPISYEKVVGPDGKAYLQPESNDRNRTSASLPRIPNERLIDPSKCKTEYTEWKQI